MRIGIVGTDLSGVSPGSGGLEHLLLGWAAGLATQFDVVVFSRGIDVSFGPTDFDLVRFDDQDHLVDLVNVLDVDVVHLNNRPSWAHRMPCPSVLTAHNPWEAWSTDQAWTRAAARDALGSVDRCTAVSGFLARSIEVEFGVECGVIFPFIDPEFIRVGERPREKERTVLFAGRLLRKKGVEFLVGLSAHPRLRDESFLFTDFIRPWREPTEEHESLRALIESRPNCTLIDPPTSREDLAELMSSASVSVVPSVWDEPFGLVAIESIAAGTRVVASNVGGLPEAVGVAGTVVDPDDEEGYVAAIVEALDRPAVDVVARAIMIERFTHETSVARLAGVLEAVAG